MTSDELISYAVNEADAAVYIVDAQTDEMLFMNKKGWELAGKESPAEGCAIGPYYKILYAADEIPADCPLAAAKKRGRNTQQKYYAACGKYYFQNCKKMQMDDGREVVLGVETDITSIRLVSKEVEKRLQIEETLIACIRTLYENDDVSTAIQALLEIVAKYHDADRSYIFEFRPEGDFLDNTYEWCASGITPQIDFLQEVDIAVIDRWMERFHSEGEFFITSLEGEVDESSAEYQILQQQDIDSLMAAPLKMGEEIVGFLGVDNPRNNTDTLLLMRSVAAFIINDLQKRKNLADLYEQSLRDILTGVGNRHAYVHDMHEMEGRTDISLGIVFVDINGLKRANDMYGHEHGDAMICEVAGILKQNFAQNIYRIGGDEFVVFVPDTSEEKFNEYMTLLKGSWSDRVTASVGGLWLAQCQDIEKQVARADRLMYLDKKEYYMKCLPPGEE